MTNETENKTVRLLVLDKERLGEVEDHYISFLPKLADELAKDNGAEIETCEGKLRVELFYQAMRIPVEGLDDFKDEVWIIAPSDDPKKDYAYMVPLLAEGGNVAPEIQQAFRETLQPMSDKTIVVGDHGVAYPSQFNLMTFDIMFFGERVTSSFLENSNH